MTDESDRQPLFLLGEGDHSYLPTEAAGSPWSRRALHGGPPCGLLGREVARAVKEANEALQPVRLTVDLFRAVPMAELTVETELIRMGRRVGAVRATLLAEAPSDGEKRAVAQASGLFLAPSEIGDYLYDARDLPPPEGLERVPMMSRRLVGKVPPGFHFEVDVRWVESSAHPRAWIRMPMSLVQGEELTAFERAATLMDFGNALASRARYKGQPEQVGFINTDATMYLTRLPVGEWLGFHCDRVADVAGIGTSECLLFDRQGCLGRVVQARLANDDPPGLR